MTTKPDESLYSDNAYLWAQLLATQSLLMHLARMTSTAEDMEMRGMIVVDTLRNIAFPRPVPESFFAGLDHFEAWLKQQTSET